MSWWQRLLGHWLPQANDEQAGNAAGTGAALAEAVAGAASPAEAPLPGAGETPESDGIWWASQPRPPGVAAAEPADTGEIQDQLHCALGAAIDDPNLALPRLPRVTDRALRMLRGNGADYAALAEQIGQDPALTAQILRVANSVAFRGFAEIRTLPAAFTRLGQRQLRAVLLDSGLRRLSLQLGGSQQTLGESIWRRSVAAGAILAALGPRCGVDEDDAFLMGLLHDIGLLIVLLVIHQRIERTGRPVPRVVFDRLAARWHEHAGLRLAEAWALPEPLPALILDHHRVPAGDDPLARPRLLIMTGDVAGALLGYGPYHPYDFFSTPCVQKLGITDTPEWQAELRALPRRIADRMHAI